ncbi:NAD(P)H-quinone dehydrogenase [Rothia sp. P6271]|uniref:NAD(P)H-quinone dehydrogenase n=1 Tax=unclassified Rothia (in: high G+C Gram-positive bacteria) TaxID=2689056 RepID=UPI003AD3AE56
MTHTTDYASRTIIILGGGPGGYEAALVASSLGAQVTLIERQGFGGSAVLTDVVPSKTLIASADIMASLDETADLGICFSEGKTTGKPYVDLKTVNERLLHLAQQQSADIKRSLERAGVTIIEGTGKLKDQYTVEVRESNGLSYELRAEFILLAVGTHPRELPTAKPDGERILNWTQLYSLKELPEELIVVGSGVTGAEFASAYNRLGSHVTLISSRDRVLPGEDEDAAEVLENVFDRRGVKVIPRSRAQAVNYSEDRTKVIVSLADGRKVQGTHCLIAVGSIPNTEDLGLEKAGVKTRQSGHIIVDKVSRTNISSIYAAGDCTGVYPLASVAAMQGRIAMAHMMGDVVKPLRTHQVAANIFTSPEIATVGITEKEIAQGTYRADTIMLSLSTNPRAKMMAVKDGFIKIFSRQHSGTVLGGVVVGPRASELIFPLALAVDKKLHVDDLAETFTVYPSLTGSISEAARKLHKAL